MWCIVPFKVLTKGKQRLAGLLPERERAGLCRAMIEDLLSALQQVSLLEGTLIVSDDVEAARLAKQFGLDAINEDGSRGEGLNNAVNHAINRLTAAAISDIMIIHGDLPLVTPAELMTLVRQHMDHGKQLLTLVPDRWRQGTNCLISTCCSPIPVCFGKDSLVLHQQAAAQQGIPLRIAELPSIMFDIDTPADLLELKQRLTTTDCSVAPRTRRYLQTVDLLRTDEPGILWDTGHGTGDESRGAAMIPTIPDKTDPGNNTSTSYTGHLSEEQAMLLADHRNIDQLMQTAGAIRDRAFGNTITYSRKVFIPLTQLCRDVCHYCTFAKSVKAVPTPYMSVEDVLAVARTGQQAGCKEALFTLGEKPELRYRQARTALERMGFESTLEYVAHVAGIVFTETGLLPHINAGCMTGAEIGALRKVSASMGLMLESAATRLCGKGLPHYGSPDKHPQARLDTIAAAGRAGVPFTSGILIGIGETRLERIESLLALRRLDERYGHIQEMIIQNFLAKAGTKMAQAPEPRLDEMLWTIAVARIIFGTNMNIQAPPNLNPEVLPQLIRAGINDWGGVSPVTPDFVNPEAPWPHIDQLAQETARAGKYLQERLTIYPRYAVNPDQWLHPDLHRRVLQLNDTEGYPRTDSWITGGTEPPPAADLNLLQTTVLPAGVTPDIRASVAIALEVGELDEEHIVRLFSARGNDFAYLCQAADQLCRQIHGNRVSYVINRNINYTNICYYKCRFCAFSKGKVSEILRDKPYLLSLDEITAISTDAWRRGATEVCMQGGIHPEFTGDTYLEICRAVKRATPAMHIHAFSPLEVWHGAETLGISVREFLAHLKQAGLSSLPGTAAEILDDEIRQVLCKDKINTGQWFEVVETAHQLGIRTTATIMYGHMEQTRHWARHLLRIKVQQQKSGGFTEFVPLPFIAAEAPIYRKGQARKGPTFREAVLMHAIARLVLYPEITNIQASWVKLGPAGIKACLHAGVNDTGGTLMYESISRSAGAIHGQELTAAQMETLIREAGRIPFQRTTFYQEIPVKRDEGIVVSC